MRFLFSAILQRVPPWWAKAELGHGCGAPCPVAACAALRACNSCKMCVVVCHSVECFGTLWCVCGLGRLCGSVIWMLVGASLRQASFTTQKSK